MRPSPEQQPPDGHLRPATPPPRTASSNPQTQGTTAARWDYTNSGDNSDGGCSSSGMHGSSDGPRRFYSARRPAAARAGEGDYNKDGKRAASSGPSGPGVGIGQMPQAVRRVGIPKGSSPQYNHWQWKLATGVFNPAPTKSECKTPPEVLGENERILTRAAARP